ncbi:Na/Pi-cotransporter II-related protein [uncultured delta proteobacterium]|uniref:Na/Pi-cotransporter II-related protein n=1 Tax=uncultured delta proteobacterium TaxID=34034 RepID=A0A212KCL5_9DELT|nr:Na/Pi-cotransporter II-related protein [uncultured delta proteobacterium]
MSLTSFLQVFAGVGLFLYGIKLLSEALQFLAGDRMRQLIGTLTRTPMRGVFIGALVTILIQSSSGVTVMTVSFVNAGLMSLAQAIGVIMGANIGTTVTAQIIAFKIKDIALPFIGMGALVAVFGRSRNQRYFGNGMVGFGLIFLGMQTMEGAMYFLRDHKDLFLTLSYHPLLGVLAGTVITMLVQSSAATIGLTMAMASQGLLSLDAAIPIILGDNIGTTITAVIAAMGTNRSAQQAAAAHVLFNVIGVLLFMLGLPLFKMAVAHTATDIGRQLANAHTMFNMVNTVLFLPFVRPFAKLVARIIPAPPPPASYDPIYLDRKLINVSTAAAVGAVKDELTHMGEITLAMSRLVRKAYKNYSEDMESRFANMEKGVNNLNKAISKYAAEIWQKRIPDSLSTELAGYVSAAGDFERIGDHYENLLELSAFKVSNSVSFTPQADIEFWDMYTTVDEAVMNAVGAVATDDMQQVNKVLNELEDAIDNKEREYRKNHIARINAQECDPERGVIFADVLSNLERIGDHTHNIVLVVRDFLEGDHRDRGPQKK